MAILYRHRPPFDGSDEYIKKRNEFVRLGLDLIMAVQHDVTVPTNPELLIAIVSIRGVQCRSTLCGSSWTTIDPYGTYSAEPFKTCANVIPYCDITHTVFFSQCDKLIARCEQLIRKSKDCLTIQPAWLELATIKRKPNEELGMHIQSSYNGTHTIGSLLVRVTAVRCNCLHVHVHVHTCVTCTLYMHVVVV